MLTKVVSIAIYIWYLRQVRLNGVGQEGQDLKTTELLTRMDPVTWLTFGIQKIQGSNENRKAELATISWAKSHLDFVATFDVEKRNEIRRFAVNRPHSTCLAHPGTMNMTNVCQTA